MSKGRAQTKSSPRFKLYPAYKDSGIEWLGQIPAHWELKRLKHLAVLNPEALPEDTDPTLEMVYVDIGGVNSLGRIVESEPLTFAAAPSRARRPVRNGDVIVSTVRTYLRAIAPISDPDPGMVVSTGFAVVRPEDGLTTGYAAYALRAPYFVERVVANSKGVSFPAINESEMATYELAVPPEPEQRAIAAFLDCEATKIDALVAKKERLLELLQEKRTALITRAVTKGFDQNVPMKDSGVEWLGQIPAHWEIKKLKYVVKGGLVNGLFKKKDQYGTGVKLINVVNLYEKNFNIDFDALEYVEADQGELKTFLVSSGDIFFVRSSLKLEGIGSAACAVAVTEPVVFECHLVRVRPSQTHISPEYLVYYLNSSLVRQRLIALAETTTMTTIAQPKLASLGIAIPSHSEQRAIVAHLDQETTKFDTLVAKVRDGIDRLKEDRIALISAAVTGKIDVRGEAV